MSYENAPATQMLATRCACCGRPLVDAISVETGVGPECRKRHGYNDAQGEPDWSAAMQVLDGFVAVADVNPALTPRAAVNVLVHAVACTGSLDVGFDARVAAVRALGFTTLADKLVEHAVGKVEVHAAGDRLAVTTPYNEAFVAALKLARCGARWDRPSKVWTVPADPAARRALWGALRAHYAGALLVTDTGTSRVPHAA
jgi:hypothetical protein